MSHMKSLNDAVHPYRRLVIEHPLHASLTDLGRVRTFMEYHIFAVWDFMCLLKALQRLVTCVEVHWLPNGEPETRRFINEIVLGEESDETEPGRVWSHFEMYLAAMHEIGASTGPIERFLSEIRAGHSVPAALQSGSVPNAAGDFVHRTMDVIHFGSPHTIAAAFTVGREKVIPGMFMEIISRLAPGCPTLHDYFRRHIDIDGNSHGLLSERLLSSLCGSDPAKWSEATESAVDALRSRKLLWDAILEKFNEGTDDMRRAA